MFTMSMLIQFSLDVASTCTESESDDYGFLISAELPDDTGRVGFLSTVYVFFKEDPELNHFMVEFSEYMHTSQADYLLHLLHETTDASIHGRARCGDLKSIIDYQQKGLSLSCDDSSKRTPLIIALKEKHYSVAWYLLELGTPIESTYQEQVMRYALQSADLAFIRLVIEKGCDPNTQAPNLFPNEHKLPRRFTALDLACIHNNQKMIRWLIYDQKVSSATGSLRLIPPSVQDHKVVLRHCPSSEIASPASEPPKLFRSNAHTDLHALMISPPSADESTLIRGMSPGHS